MANHSQSLTSLNRDLLPQMTQTKSWPAEVDLAEWTDRWLTWRTQDLAVSYAPDLDGGGSSFGQRYLPVLATLYPNRRFTSCFEWCSGPGFIGFSLLANGVCDQLYLNDIYLPNIRAIQSTIDQNQSLCHDRVWYQHCGQISQLPAHWRFDLVVANPPHFNPNLGQYFSMIWGPNNRLCTDPNWQVHEEFFDNINPHLSDDAVILLQENMSGSGPIMFQPMIERNGFRINDCYHETALPQMYYIEIRRR